MRAQALPGAVLGLVLASAAAGQDIKEIHRTLPLDAAGTASIETYKGSIDVTGWDRPEIEVSARIEPDPEGDDQAEKVRETQVRIEGSGPRVRIETDYSGVRRRGFLGMGEDGTMPLVRYTIHMPRSARLQVKDYKSHSRIEGLSGGLELDTYKGDVRLAEVGGSVRLETYKGEVRAEFARFAESRFETYKGDIEIAIPRGAAFQIDADLGRRGDLSSDFEASIRMADGGHHRSAVGGGGGPSLRLETSKGRFRLRAK
jgi:hypothetical protein